MLGTTEGAADCEGSVETVGDMEGCHDGGMDGSTDVLGANVAIAVVPSDDAAVLRRRLVKVTVKGMTIANTTKIKMNTVATMRRLEAVFMTLATAMGTSWRGGGVSPSSGFSSTTKCA